MERKEVFFGGKEGKGKNIFLLFTTVLSESWQCLHTAGLAHHVSDLEDLCPQNLLNFLYCPEPGMSGVLKSQWEMF